MHKVLIVDDELLLRSALQRILEVEPDIEVPATCDGPEAVETVLRHRPDVVLLDLRMPSVDGLTVLRELRARPRPPVVTMLTTFCADEEIAAALRAGATGYLLKDTAPQELVSSVRLLASGGTVFSPGPAGFVVDSYLSPGSHNSPDPRIAGLTEREREVLTLLGEGLSNAEIGQRLLVSTATVKDHVSAVLAKLGLANRAQAAVFAHKSGLTLSA